MQMLSEAVQQKCNKLGDNYIQYITYYRMLSTEYIMHNILILNYRRYAGHIWKYWHFCQETIS